MLIAFGSGLAALLTPWVFPMIPLTVFLLKQEYRHPFKNSPTSFIDKSVARFELINYINAFISYVKHLLNFCTKILNYNSFITKIKNVGFRKCIVDNKSTMNYYEIYPKGIFRDYINAFGSNIKEWTYAGFGITLISAFVAHASVGDGVV